MIGVIAALVVANGIACAVGVWVVLRAIAAMGRDTAESVRWSFVAKSAGLALQLAAALDYFLGDPYAWPWLMLAGVALANVGTAALYVLNRKAAGCQGCSNRKQFWCAPR